MDAQEKTKEAKGRPTGVSLGSSTCRVVRVLFCDNQLNVYCA